MSVRLVNEFEVEFLATGVERRSFHIHNALSDSRHQVLISSLNPGIRRNVSGIGRVIQGIRWSRSFQADESIVVMNCLGSPAMMAASAVLSWRRVPLIIDVCDSLTGQLASRWRARDLRAMLIQITCLALFLLVNRRAACSYVTGLDALQDRWLGHPVRVIPPSVAKSAASLAPISFPLTRVVVLGDLNSHHNRSTAETLDKVLERSTVELSVDVYGPEPHGLPHVKRHHRGWAEDVADVYEGDSVLLVTNNNGTGLPNKLLEARAAARPIIVSSCYRVPIDGLTGYVYDNQDPVTGLLSVLNDIARGAAPRRLNSETGDTSVPELSSTNLATVAKWEDR